MRSADSSCSNLRGEKPTFNSLFPELTLAQRDRGRDFLPKVSVVLAQLGESVPRDVTGSQDRRGMHSVCRIKTPQAQQTNKHTNKQMPQKRKQSA